MDQKVVVRCGACESKFNAAPSLIGKKLTCPKCKKPFVAATETPKPAAGERDELKAVPYKRKSLPGPFPYFWTVLAVALLAGGAAALYFFVLNDPRKAQLKSSVEGLMSAWKARDADAFAAYWDPEEIDADMRKKMQAIFDEIESFKEFSSDISAIEIKGDTALVKVSVRMRKKLKQGREEEKNDIVLISWTYRDGRWLVRKGPTG